MKPFSLSSRANQTFQTCRLHHKLLSNVAASVFPELCITWALIICAFIQCVCHQHFKYNLILIQKLGWKDLTTVCQHSVTHWLDHWGTTISAQSEVPHLFLIGPDGVFIIRVRLFSCYLLKNVQHLSWNYAKPLFVCCFDSFHWDSLKNNNSLFSWDFKRFGVDALLQDTPLFSDHCWEFLQTQGC